MDDRGKNSLEPPKRVTTPSDQTAENKTDKDSARTIEIKLTVPKLPPRVYRPIQSASRKIHNSSAYRFITKKVASLSPRSLRVGGLVGIALLIAYTGYSSNRDNYIHNGEVSGSSSAPVLTKGTPDYTTILPSGKDIDSLGGWTRISPPDGNPVFAYVDTIEETPISVSQQPLPTDFENDTEDQVDQLAQSFNANERITVDDTRVHIGTSAEGPQSVIFHSDGLLVLIKANNKVDNNKWAAYIKSLQ